MFKFLIAMARPQGQSGQITNPVSAFMPLIFMFFIIYFLLLRPQHKKQREHQKMLTELQKGDKIITTGGIHGIVVNIKDDVITVKIAENVKIDITRNSISVVRKEEKAGTEGQ